MRDVSAKKIWHKYVTFIGTFLILLTLLMIVANALTGLMVDKPLLSITSAARPAVLLQPDYH